MDFMCLRYAAVGRIPGSREGSRPMPLTEHRVRKQQFHDRLGILHHRTLRHKLKLKKRFPAAFNTRWTRRHWVHASLFATLGALIATKIGRASCRERV